MNDSVKRITISGESGYGPIEEAYKDKVTIEPNTIRYDYIPFSKSEINPERKWSYRTTSPIFQKIFEDVCISVRSVLDSEIVTFCTDVGSIVFRITYESGKVERKTYWCTSDEFKDCFILIKKMVPDCEYIPAVLLTEDDYAE